MHTLLKREQSQNLCALLDGQQNGAKVQSSTEFKQRAAATQWLDMIRDSRIKIRLDLPSASFGYLLLMEFGCCCNFIANCLQPLFVIRSLYFDYAICRACPQVLLPQQQQPRQWQQHLLAIKQNVAAVQPGR